VRDIVTDPEYLDVFLPAGKSFTHAVRAGHTVFAYVIEGEGYFDQGRDPFDREAVGDNYFDLERPCVCGINTLAVYGLGDAVVVTTQNEAVRFLLVSGKPLKEPVAWYGPIVMNSQEELRAAFEEYQQGTFLKHANR
jgi:hypothetical protein